MQPVEPATSSALLIEENPEPKVDGEGVPKTETAEQPLPVVTGSL